MKNTFKEVNKIIKDNDLLESPEEFMKQFGFQRFKEFKMKNSIDEKILNTTSINKTKKGAKDIDKVIKDIDQKLEELSKLDKNNN